LDDYTHPSKLTETEAPPAARRSWLPRILGAVVVIGVIIGCVLYWLDARHYESTDDAFIDGNISQVSAQISGRVIKLLVNDNQVVTAGQELVELDPRDAQMRLDQMQAQRDQAAAQLEQARATLPVRQADLDQASANIRVSQAETLQTQRDLGRYTAINPHAISAQTIDSARASSTSAAARLDAARQAEAGARAQLAVAKTQVAGAEAALRLADANLADARLNLSYTRILAPADGRIARRTVQLGNYITPGQALLAVVQPDCWVTANFKEAQLADMRPGQPAKIAIDAFGGRVLDGHVDSLQSGTGAVFSSLPAENATGNYVKIVQRVPVKLLFDGDACKTMALAQGMSVIPRVKLR
jgi:membrane fusion protein (multidrug efflux system)